MIVAITGATGFIGRHLGDRLRSQGHQIRAISLRSPVPPDALEGVNGVVHLAGESVAQRWTPEVRRRIVESRVEGTRRLVEAMRPHPPQVLVSASAVGYYGSRGDEILTESSPPATGFLGETCVAWEKAALEAEPLGVRVVRLRIGVVLGRDGGALEKLVVPFRLGLGGPIAGGHHWQSWIHIDDLVELILFMLHESTVRGAFNATSPHPVTNAEFTRALAAAVHRPAFWPIPALALKIFYGDMSHAVIASQRVIPEAATRAGFTFRYPDVYGAMNQILDHS